MKRTTGSDRSSKASPVGPHALIVVALSTPRVRDRVGARDRAVGRVKVRRLGQGNGKG